MANRISYRELHRYKYQLMDEYIQEDTGIYPAEDIELQFLGLSKAGRLRIAAGYA